MKTLDEVIKAYEVCHASVLSCEGCPYDNGETWRDDACYVPDALHYLKEYQTLQYGYVKAMADLEDNPPLSWDELKRMEGKPVWVELTYPEGGYSHWGIIEGFPKAGYEFITLRGFHQIDFFSLMDEMMGKTWKAYRKERK